MTSTPLVPAGLSVLTNSPVEGLAVFSKPSTNPKATVICIHGGLDRGGSFARMARRLDDFDVLTYDRRGYQSSRDLSPLDIEHHIDDLLGIAEFASARGPVLYFGHSFGGTVALGAAIREPALSQGVVAFESPLPWVLNRISSREELSDDPEFEAEMFFRRMVGNKSWERLSEQEKQSRRADGAGLLSDLGLLRKRLVPYDLSQLSVPTLYVHGDGMMVDYYRELVKLLPDFSPSISSMELAAANHGAHLSNPDQLAQLLREFWTQQCE